MMHVFMRALPAAIAIGALAMPGAVAQTEPPPAANEQNAPTHFDSQARPGETLTERLDRTDGVIRPPAHVDPEMHEKPPPTGDKGIFIPLPSPDKPVTPK